MPVKDKTFEKYDGSAVPVIACDGIGKVVYKNSSAKKLVPFPRTGNSISKYVNPHLSDITGNTRRHSIIDFGTTGYYKKAVTLEGPDGFVLMFPLMLQFLNVGSNDLKEVVYSVADKYEERRSKRIGTDAADTGSLIPPRALIGMRESSGGLYEYFIRNFDLKPYRDIRQVLNDVSALGKEAFGKYRFRMEYDTEKLSGSDGRFVSYAAFSFVFSQLCVLILGLSSNGGVIADFDDLEDRIEARISCKIRNAPSDAGALGPGFLYERYPGESDNIAELEYLIGAENWKLSFEYDAGSGMLCAILDICDRSKDFMRLFEDDEAFPNDSIAVSADGVGAVIETYIGAKSAKKFADRKNI